eukprot:9276-Heterococcus_DN1.PRE.1
MSGRGALMTLPDVFCSKLTCTDSQSSHCKYYTTRAFGQHQAGGQRDRISDSQRLKLSSAHMTTRSVPRCCLCQYEAPETFEAPAFSVEGRLLGPVSCQADAGTQDLYIHTNCLLAATGFRHGLRHDLPPEIMEFFTATGLEGSKSCTLPEDSAAFLTQYADQIVALWQRHRDTICKQCSANGASVCCAAAGCSVAMHVDCASSTSPLIATPVLPVDSTIRPGWVWLCAAHASKACKAAGAQLPEPQPGA